MDRPADPEIVLHAVSRGLRPSLLKRIIQEDCTTLANLRRVATREEVAERIDIPANQNKAAVNALEKRMESEERQRDRQPIQRPPRSMTGALCPNCYNTIGKYCFYPDNCPARHQFCGYCNGKGHFKRACELFHRERRQGKLNSSRRQGGGTYYQH